METLTFLDKIGKFSRKFDACWATAHDHKLELLPLLALGNARNLGITNVLDQLGPDCVRVIHVTQWKGILFDPRNAEG